MTRPDVTHKGVRLYRGDSLSLLKKFDGDSFDLTLTDPPYNVDFQYNTIKDNRKDYESWCASWLKVCERVTDGPVCFSCGHSNLGMWHRIKQPRWVMCWWKPAAMGRSPVGFCNWEPMLLYGKTVANRNLSDVIRGVISAKKALSWHPCPKPLEWGTKFIKALSKKGGRVLDPFMGSGTVGVACVQTGREYVGVEIDELYFSKAAERIRTTLRVPCFFE